MRGSTPEAKIRGVERALGIDVEHKPGSFTAFDPTLERTFVALYKIPSRFEYVLDSLHEAIYRARGAEVNRRQEGKCCFCGKKMPRNSYEVDHIVSRAHGRDDRIPNLRTCCTGSFGCKGHRIRHGG